MKNKHIVSVAILLILSLAITFFMVNRDLTIHIIAITSTSTSPISLKIDEEVVFSGDITSGPYFGEKITIENIGLGPYSVKVNAIASNFTYHDQKYFWFNRTLIISYYDGTLTEEPPGFDVWSKFGKFLPD